MKVETDQDEIMKTVEELGIDLIGQEAIDMQEATEEEGEEEESGEEEYYGEEEPSMDDEEAFRNGIDLKKDI
ncbi:MAG: hypothetical protein FJW61_06690 [Actinobacteria bacterium]|nr:hypothetical protein [Actinomycetota bacterium]